MGREVADNTVLAARLRYAALWCTCLAAICRVRCNPPVNGARRFKGECVEGSNQSAEHRSCFTPQVPPEPAQVPSNLLAPHIVTTDASGFFNITGDYVCPTAATQVYLVARGGNPGLTSSVNNSALVMMAALGNCGDLTNSTSIEINEVTTVAAAWALSQFLGPGAIVGSTSTNATGLANAFAVANNLGRHRHRSCSRVRALPTGAVTETAKLYTLADVLAVCVNSDGGSACCSVVRCGNNLSGRSDQYARRGSQHCAAPWQQRCCGLQCGSPQGPFQPVLNTQPNDWTMSITYGGCTPRVRWAQHSRRARNRFRRECPRRELLRRRGLEVFACGRARVGDWNSRRRPESVLRHCDRRFRQRLGYELSKRDRRK